MMSGRPMLVPCRVRRDPNPTAAFWYRHRRGRQRNAAEGYETDLEIAFQSKAAKDFCLTFTSPMADKRRNTL